MNRYRKELRALRDEIQEPAGGVVVLTMEDGTQHELPTSRQDDLWRKCFQNPDCPEARLLKSAVEIIEPDDGAMYDMLQAILLTPRDETEAPHPQAMEDIDGVIGTNDPMDLRLLNLEPEGGIQ